MRLAALEAAGARAAARAVVDCYIGVADVAVSWFAHGRCIFVVR